MNELVYLLKERLVIEKERLDRSGSYGFTQRNLAFNSNKIEGSTLTLAQTASLFDTGTIKGDTLLRSKDIEETTGHFTMFNEMLNTYNEPLSEKLIKKYHYCLKSGVFEDIANGYPIGEYKNRANIVSDIKTTAPNEVSAKILELINNYNHKVKITLEDIAEFHVNYELIHPFQDGNGRTGRIIMYKECLKHNIFPFIIEDSKKGEYYSCLHKAQAEQDFIPLIEFFKLEQEIYYHAIKDFLQNIIN